MNDIYEEYDYEEDDVEALGDDDEEEFEDLMAEFAGEEDEDAAERRRRRARHRRSRAKSRGVTTAGSGRSFRPRMEKSYATQAQLQAASTRLDKKISDNAQAIKKVNGRVNDLGKHVTTLRSRLDNHADALKKEKAERSKSDEKLRKDLQMAMLLPMLLQPPQPLSVTTEEDTVGGVDIPVGTKLATAPAPDNNMSMMLPLMMMGGESGGGDNNMMMLVLAMTMMKP